MRCNALNHLAVLCSLLLPAALGRAAPTNNLELVAVPAPGKVVIDGKLDGWDLSGSILSCPDTRSYLPVAAIRSAAMYDGAGIYLSCRWTDPTPMANMVDPDEPGKLERGWMSDSLQVRIFTDEEIHVTAWYFKGKDKPAMHVQFGSPTRPSTMPNLVRGLDNGAKMAFEKSADGMGYVQEAFLPWKLVSKTGKPYKAGDVIGFGLHFNWGSGDNRSTRGLQWQDVVSGPEANRTFFWQDRNTWGKLRFSPTGRIKLPRQPWDADDAGPELATYGPVEIKYELPADSKVTLAIEDAKGRRVRNLIAAHPRSAGVNLDRWDGCDDRGRPLEPGQYRWRGLYHPGIDVRYNLHLMPHTNPPWSNSEGTGGWGSDHSAPTYLAAHGDRVYLLYEGAEGGSAMLACDLSGNKIWGHGGAFQGGGLVCTADGNDLYYADQKFSKSSITRVDTKTGKAVRFATGAASLPTGLSNDYHHREMPTGIALRGDRLYLACANKNVIRVFDLKTDKQITDLKVPAPFGLAFDRDRRLLAVSGDKVVRVDEKTGAITPLIDKGLNRAHGLAVGADGLIHVVNSGTHQVFTYTSGGKRVRQTGTPGGRPPVGKWDRNGLLNPTGVGVDGDGNLWVAETDGVARRLSKWGKDGKNLGEWLGPTPYGGDGIVDHRDRSRIYCGGLEFKADWKTGTARPVWTHLRGVSAGQPASAGMVAYGSFWYRQGFTITYKGHHYFCFDRGLICIKRGNAWVPCAAIGYVKRQENNDNFLWSDRNEDGKVQDDEIVQPGGFNPFGAALWGVLWSRKDLSTVRRVDGGRVIRFTPAEFTPNGVPIFDKRSLSTVQLPVDGSPVDVDDDTMIAFYEDSHAPHMQGLREHSLGDMSGIKGFNRKGRLLWTYPQPFSGVHGSFKAPLPTMPGEVIGTIYIMGTADLGKQIGKIVCFNGYYGQRFLMTADGLFVQALFKDGRMMPATPEKAVRDMLINDMSPGNEAYAGTFSRNDNGEVYLTSGFGGPMCVVISVKGLEKIRRLSGGPLTLTGKLVQQGLDERRRRAAEAARETPRSLTIVRGKRKIDGSLDEWNLAGKGVGIRADARRTALAGLAHDDEYLYAAFRVQDNSPWRNGGKEPKVMFLYGDGVDIQLGLDPKADPHRRAPAAGDVRIAIAPQQQEATVMLYRPIVPDHPGPRVPFVSPVGRVELDSVEQVDNARAVVKTSENGYVVEAAIPLERLGGKLPSGAKLRGDVGVLYSDDPGTECVLRRYWSNRDTNVTNDLPTEIRFQPHEWGQFVVE